MHSVSLVSFPQLISRQEGGDGCVYSVVDCFAPHTLTFLHYWKWRMLREFDFDKINGDGARKRQIFINKLCRSHDSSEKIKNKKRYARHKRVVKMIDGLLLLFKCHSMLNLCFNKILPRVRSLSLRTQTHIHFSSRYIYGKDRSTNMYTQTRSRLQTVNRLWLTIPIHVTHCTYRKTAGELLSMFQCSNTALGIANCIWLVGRCTKRNKIYRRRIAITCAKNVCSFTAA